MMRRLSWKHWSRRSVCIEADAYYKPPRALTPSPLSPLSTKGEGEQEEIRWRRRNGAALVTAYGLRPTVL